VALLLTLGPVALLVRGVLLAHGAALLATELPALDQLALPTLAPTAGLASLVLPWLSPPHLAAGSLLAVLLATARVGLLNLLATPLLPSPLLAALRLGLPALLQAVPVRPDCVSRDPSSPRMPSCCRPCCLPPCGTARSSC
jgi:hypothetical protein